MRRFLLSCFALGCGLTSFVLPCRAGDELPEAIVTDERRFEIPLEIAAGDPSIAEVRLYCSADTGKTWHPALKSKPPVEGFEFQAPGDGEFWFAVRTADGTGKEEPNEPFAAELRVVVDSAAPQIDLQTERKPTGDVTLRWSCRDRGWKTDSLKISYRTTDDAPWIAVHSLKTKRHGDQSGGGGEIEWTPPSDAAAVSLKIEAEDLAGNTTAKETKLQPDLVAAATPPVLAPSTTPAPAPASAAAASGLGLQALRDPTRPLWVNSLSFELEYDVGPVDQQNVREVAIWGTRDDGRTWVQLGVDDDRRSPCAVNVDREGMYGFAIVVGAGPTSNPPPKAGDAPEIRVGVDLQKPQVRLTTAEPDASGRPCAMKINWLATDANLGPQAVSLAYAASPQGPWLPLALGIANDGGRSCEFEPTGPDAVYLRIEVRDEAGNLGAYSTTVPLPVEKREAAATVAGFNRGRGLQAAPKWYHVLR